MPFCPSTRPFQAAQNRGERFHGHHLPASIVASVAGTLVGEAAGPTAAIRTRSAQRRREAPPRKEHKRPVRSSLRGALPYPHLSKISPELPMQPIRGRAKEKCEKDADIGYCPKGEDKPRNDGRQLQIGRASCRERV